MVSLGRLFFQAHWGSVSPSGGRRISPEESNLPGSGLTVEGSARIRFQVAATALQGACRWVKAPLCRSDTMPHSLSVPFRTSDERLSVKARRAYSAPEPAAVNGQVVLEATFHQSNPEYALRDPVPKWIVFRQVLAHPVLMHMNDMRPAQFLCVACPTCGVCVGERCLLLSGSLRSQSHLDRKLIAVVAVEQKRIHRIQINSHTSL